MPEIRDLRKPGWLWIHHSIIEDYGPKLGVYGIATYTLLALCASKETQEAWPSLRTMAKTLGIGLSSVQKAIDQLVALGLVSRTHRKTAAGDYTSNTYALLDCPKPGQGGVPGENTPVLDDGTPVLPEHTRVYPEEVHRIPQGNTEQELVNKNQPEQQPSPPSAVVVNDEAKTHPMTYTPPLTFTVTPAMRAWATKQYPSLDIDAVTTAFRARTFAEPQEDWGKVWFQMIRQAGEGRRRPVTVQDETSTWHKGPVQLPPVVRPDDVLTQAGLVEGSPAYTALYAQADAELVAEGLSPDLRKRPIVEARMTVIAERRQAGMEPPQGCAHPPAQVDADGRCHRCGVELDGCAAAD